MKEQGEQKNIMHTHIHTICLVHDGANWETHKIQFSN